METKRKLFVYIPRIGQYLVPHTLATISLLADFSFHDRFYLLHPEALWFCAPVIFALVYISLRLDNKRDKRINAAYKSRRMTPQKENEWYKKLLKIEKYTYYFLFFLIDTIASFELISIICLTLRFNIFLLYSWLFPISLAYASFVHFVCRVDDFSERYDKLEAIFSTQNFSIPWSITPTSATVSLLIVSFVILQALPILSLCCFLLGLYLSIYYRDQHIRTFYSIYLFRSSFSHLQNFSRLALLSSPLLNFILPYPKIIPYSKIAYQSLALLCASVYYSSTVRDEHLAKLYDSNTSEAHP